MNKKIIYGILITMSLLIITGCNYKKKNNDISPKVDKINEVTYKVKAIINEKEYIINLENNATAKSFIEMLPLKLEMNELNGNEKYYYLDSSLPTNSSNPKYIEKGDLMLYNDDCLVLFYKSFNTSYNYTKIGHIDNMPDLKNNNISIRFEK